MKVSDERVDESITSSANRVSISDGDWCPSKVLITHHEVDNNTEERREKKENEKSEFDVSGEFDQTTPSTCSITYLNSRIRRIEKGTSESKFAIDRAAGR